jgi:hypothetical protein
MQALNATYALDQKQFKSAIGSLNWLKFSERISSQLKENQLLTN